jgi:hypothetical protein
VEFSLNLRAHKLEASMRPSINPFTGEPVGFPPHLGLSAAERVAVKEFLEEFGEGDPDAFSREIALPDGSTVDITLRFLYLDAPCAELTLVCAVPTVETATFVLELAMRGNMSIESMHDRSMVAVPGSVYSEENAHRWPSAELVDTPAELLAWLQDCIDEDTID